MPSLETVLAQSALSSLPYQVAAFSGIAVLQKYLLSLLSLNVLDGTLRDRLRARGGDDTGSKPADLWPRRLACARPGRARHRNPRLVGLRAG